MGMTSDIVLQYTFSVFFQNVYTVTCQAHPALVKRLQCTVLSFSIFSSLLPGSPVGVRSSPPDNGPKALCLVAAWSQGGSLETPPRWHVTIR